jgi:hypothetical protein
VEFLAQIEDDKKAVAWAFRAANARNYYACMAAHCAEQLLKIRPDSRVAHEGLAAAAFAALDYEKSAAHCAALVKVAPDAF